MAERPHTSFMKTKPGLRFIAIIITVLCVAIALRAFGSKKRPDHEQFILTIFPAAPLTDGAKDKAIKLLEKGKHCHMQYAPDVGSDFEWICGGTAKSEQTGDKDKSPSPHIQQKVEFASATSLKMLIDALATPAPSEPPVKPTVPPGTGPIESPPPKIQQTAGLETPQTEKAIAAAL